MESEIMRSEYPCYKCGLTCYLTRKSESTGKAVICEACLSRKNKGPEDCPLQLGTNAESNIKPNLEVLISLPIEPNLELSLALPGTASAPNLDLSLSLPYNGPSLERSLAPSYTEPNLELSLAPSYSYDEPNLDLSL